MRQITATGGECILIDDEDFDEVSKCKWRVDYRHPKGSPIRTPSTVREAVGNGKSLPRMLMDAPPDRMVDHINGDDLDNRRSNLRLCGFAENTWNKRVSRTSRSGFKGVFPYESKEKPWRARIVFQGKRQTLGTFATKEEAHAAYLAASARLYGQFSASAERHVQALLPEEKYTAAPLICLWHECGKSFHGRGRTRPPGYCCQEHRALDKTRRDRARKRSIRQQEATA